MKGQNFCSVHTNTSICFKENWKKWSSSDFIAPKYSARNGESTVTNWWMAAKPNHHQPTTVLESWHWSAASTSDPKLRSCPAASSGLADIDINDPCHGHHHKKRHLYHPRLLPPLMALLLPLLHLLLFGSHGPLSFQLLPIMSPVVGIKIINGPSIGLVEVSGSLLLLVTCESTGCLFSGRSPCTLDVRPVQDALVVPPPQVDVAQDRIGLADLRETLGGLFAARVLVRVVDEGLFVVRCFDLGLGGVGGYFEDVIIGRPTSVRVRRPLWPPAETSGRCWPSQNLTMSQFTTQILWSDVCQNEEGGAEPSELLRWPEGIRVDKNNSSGPGRPAVCQQPLLEEPWGDEQSCSAGLVSLYSVSTAI